jgi:hypothetical protein
VVAQLLALRAELSPGHIAEARRVDLLVEAGAPALAIDLLTGRRCVAELRHPKECRARRSQRPGD